MFPGDVPGYHSFAPLELDLSLKSYSLQPYMLGLPEHSRQ